MFDAFCQRDLQALKLLHRLTAPETESGLWSYLTRHTECSSRINREAMDIITMAHEMLLCIRFLVQYDTYCRCVVDNLPVRRVSEIVPHIVTTVPINIFEFQVLYRCDSLSFWCLVTIWSFVLLTSRHPLITFAEVFFFEFILFDGPGDRFSLLNFCLISLESYRLTLSLQIIIKIWCSPVSTTSKIDTEVLGCSDTRICNSLEDLFILFEEVLELSKVDHLVIILIRRSKVGSSPA
jgi:hypothetical protein